MSAIVDPAPSKITGDTDDPYRYGWRYVPCTLPNGQPGQDQIPLTLEDLLHPQEGDIIVENDPHDIDRMYCRNVFTWVMTPVAGAQVVSDLRIGWEVPGV